MQVCALTLETGVWGGARSGNSRSDDPGPARPLLRGPRDSCGADSSRLERWFRGVGRAVAEDETRMASRNARPRENERVVDDKGADKRASRNAWAIRDDKEGGTGEKEMSKRQRHRHGAWNLTSIYSYRLDKGGHWTRGFMVVAPRLAEFGSGASMYVCTYDVPFEWLMPPWTNQRRLLIDDSHWLSRLRPTSSNPGQLDSNGQSSGPDDPVHHLPSRVAYPASRASSLRTDGLASPPCTA